MSFFDNLAKKLFGDYQNAIPRSTGGEMPSQPQSGDTMVGTGPQVDMAELSRKIMAARTPVSTSGPSTDQKIPLLNPEAYIMGEQKGPLSMSTRTSVNTRDTLGLIDPTKLVRDPKTGLEARYIDIHGKDHDTLKLVGQQIMAGKDIRANRTDVPVGSKGDILEMRDLRDWFAATGGRRGGGGSGGSSSPPFNYNWDRPATPQLQRAPGFQFDRTDPMPENVRSPEPEPYERDKQRYAKLLGS